MTSAISRKDVRWALHDLVEVELVGDGQVYAVSYKNKVAKFEKSPVFAVTSGPTTAQDMTLRGHRAMYALSLWSFVIESLPDATWTEAMALDKLDEIDLALRLRLEQIRVNRPTWERLSFPGQASEIDLYTIGGVTYYGERLPVNVIVF